MLRRVALVRTYVSKDRSASFIRVTRIGELGTTLAVTSNRRTLRQTLSSSDMSVLTRATRRNIPEDASLQVLGSSYFVALVASYCRRTPITLHNSMEQGTCSKPCIHVASREVSLLL
jgi:hypothetical protein